MNGPIYTYNYENLCLFEEKINYYFSQNICNYINPSNIIEKNLLLTKYVIKNELNINIERLYLKFDYNINSKKYIDNWICENNLKEFIIFSPNTSRDIKKIKKNILIDLYNNYKDKIKIVIIGYNLDKYTKELTDNINSLFENKLLVFNNNDLNHTAYLLSKSKLNICHDSCILHLSNLLELNTFGIFGPTCAKWYGGNYNKNYKYIQGNTTFIRNKNFKDKSCFDSINIKNIFNMIDEFLN